MTPSFKQYFGPNRRLPEACMEISFGAGERKFSLRALTDSLRQAGRTLPDPVTDRELSLPEAAGILASACVNDPLPPRWSWGLEEETGWVCLAHIYPSLARLLLEHSHLAFLELPDSGPSPDSLKQLLGRVPKISPVRLRIFEAAAMLGLNVTFVSHYAGIFQVGQGSRGRHFTSLTNDADSVTAHMLAGHKLATVETLHRVGLPTTRAVALSRPGDAAEAIRRVGFPCVVKPVNRGKGLGVTTHLNSDLQVARAVAHAIKFSSWPLLLENHVDGLDHRMLVADGNLMWAYRRTPPGVTGDGKATVEELILHENLRREAAGDKSIKKIVTDAELEAFLQDQYAMTLHSVVPAGTGITLRGQANVAQGGVLDDVTAMVHADNRDLAIKTARVFRASALGIDFITPDISRSWKDVPTAIVEVNLTPGISGIGDACLPFRKLMPRRLSGKLPAFVVVGSGDYQQRVTDVLAAVLAAGGLAMGYCVYAPGSRRAQVTAETMQNVRALEIEALLLDPNVDALVVACSAETLEGCGFPLDSCDVLFTEESLPAYVAPLTGRLVTENLADDEIFAIAEAALAPYLDPELGGLRPAVEWAGGPEADPSGEETTLKIRCWRIHAIPRAAFLQHLDQARSAAGAGAQPFGMIGYDDIFEELGRAANEALGRAGHAGDIVLPRPVPGLAWDTPYVEIALPVRGERRESVTKALDVAMNRINALLTRME